MIEDIEDVLKVGLLSVPGYGQMLSIMLSIGTFAGGAAAGKNSYNKNNNWFHYINDTCNLNK